MPKKTYKTVTGEIVTKHPGGRPLLYKTVEELELRIQDYFDECDNAIQEIHPKEGESYAVSKPIPYTMSGLAESLGMDRTSLINYGHRDKYFNTIKRAKQKVERRVEERMLSSSGVVAGYIFSLKNNFGWKDKTEQDLTVKMPKPILGSASVQEDEE